MLRLLIAVTFLLPMSSHSAVNWVTNGSFEVGNPSGTSNYAATTTSQLFGWTYVEGYYNDVGRYVDVFSNGYFEGKASDGNWFVELEVNKNEKNGAILQNFSGLAGKYLLSFDFSGIPGNDPSWGTSTFQVLWNGIVQSTIIPGLNPQLEVNGNLVNVNDWKTFTLELESSGSVDALIFRAIKDCGCSDGIGARIDNVNLVAVPEPETYGMMLAGLAILGFVSRRRKH